MPGSEVRLSANIYLKPTGYHLREDNYTYVKTHLGALGALVENPDCFAIKSEEGNPLHLSILIDMDPMPPEITDCLVDTFTKLGAYLSQAARIALSIDGAECDFYIGPEGTTADAAAQDTMRGILLEATQLPAKQLAELKLFLESYPRDMPSYGGQPGFLLLEKAVVQRVILVHAESETGAYMLAPMQSQVLGQADICPTNYQVLTSEEANAWLRINRGEAHTAFVWPRDIERPTN